MLAAVRGGVESMALHHHWALEAQGCDVVSVGHPDGRLAQGLAGRPGVFFPFAARSAGDPVTAWRLQGLLRTLHPDLLLIHGARALRLATAWPRRVKAPTALVVHNFRLKREAARADLIVAVSAPVAKAARARFPASAVTIVENFAPLAVAPVADGFVHPVVLGALGRLHVNKGLDLLLDAVARLLAEGRDMRLIVAGDGPEEGALRRQARRLGLEDRVSFAGWSQAPAFFAGVDVFVSAARVEPFGLVVVEAMAAGRPVVSTNVDGPARILQGGTLGALAKPRARRPGGGHSLCPRRSARRAHPRQAGPGGRSGDLRDGGGRCAPVGRAEPARPSGLSPGRGRAICADLLKAG